jgi:hypothetical protein
VALIYPHAPTAAGHRACFGHWALVFHTVRFQIPCFVHPHSPAKGAPNMSEPLSPAIVLDLDGTLIDSRNDLAFAVNLTRQ